MTDQTVSTLPIKPSATDLRGTADAILFLGFLVLGFAIIVGLKLLGYHPYVVTGLAVASMITYAFLAFARPTVRVRPDKLGDNLYYMGFVFTLASMSAALIQLRGGTDPQVIIDSFGIALFTTIAGIVGRVVCLQVRTEVEDVEEMVKSSILEGATALRSKMTAAQLQFAIFQRGVEAALEDMLKRSTEAFQTNLNQSNAAFESSTTSYLENLSRFNTELLGEAKTNSIAYREIGAEIKSGASKTVAALNALPARLESIQVPANLIDSKMTPIFDAMKGVVIQFEANARVEGERFASIGETARSLSETVSLLQLEIERLSGLSGQAAKAASGSASLQATLRDVNETMRLAMEGFKTTITDLGNSMSEAKRQQADAQRLQIEASGVFLGSIRELGERLNDFKSTLSTSDIDLRTATQEFQLEITKAASIMRETAAMLQEGMLSKGGPPVEASGSQQPESRLGRGWLRFR